MIKRVSWPGSDRNHFGRYVDRLEGGTFDAKIDAAGESLDLD